MNPYFPIKSERFLYKLILSNSGVCLEGVLTAENIEGPLGKTYELLNTAKARFDCIVVDRTGMVPTEGLPATAKAQVQAQPTGRRIRVGAAVAEPVLAETDAAYAAWTVANNLLTAAGEGVALVPDASLKLIEGSEWYSRVWAAVAKEGGVTALYFAADYARSGPKVPLYNDGQAEAILAYRTSALAHSATIASTYDLDDTSVPRFRAVRSEARRRAEGKPYWNVRLSIQNELLFQITGFQQYADILTGTEALRYSSVSGKRLMDLATLADFRANVTELLKRTDLTIHPAIKPLWEDTLRMAQLLRVPLVRPGMTQRIAWLDEAQTIKCREEFFANDGSVDESGQESSPSFVENQHYPVTSHVFLGCKLEKRYHPGKGGTEDVLITGQELMLQIRDGMGRLHSFTQFPVSDEQKRNEFANVARFHRLQKLVKHFQLPDVPDIATTDPELYQTYVNRLHDLETA